jgi:hypothetical protein
MRIILPAVIIIIQSSSWIAAQIYDRPIYSLTSHPTLDIVSIERWEDRMVVELSLKNESFSGAFCIDSSTVLKNSLAQEEYSMISMQGIPACPEVYRFKSVGERISINLIFPPVPDDVKYVDLVENCDENCVSVKYILLDEELNSRLNEGFRLYELGKPESSLRVFEDIMRTEFDGFSPVFGTVYLYMIAIHYELGNSKDARNVFRELQESSILGREEFIETARETGIVR